MRLSRIIVLLSIFSVLFSLVLALNLIPQMRGGFGWRWAYAAPDDLIRIVPAVLSIVGYVSGAWLWRKQSFRLQLAWAIGGSVAITLACLCVWGDPLYLLFTRTVSGAATGPHEAGAEISNLATTWQMWPTLMLSYLQPGAHAMLSAHVALDPPGMPTLFYLARKAFSTVPGVAATLANGLRPYQCQTFVIMAYDDPTLASAWLGMLSPLWGALTVLPLFFVARRQYGDSVARIVVFGWPLIPAMALFTPTGNTLYPLVTTGSLGALVYGLDFLAIGKRIHGHLWLGVGGLLAGFASFLNFSTLPILGFFGLFTLIRAYARRDNWLKPVVAGISFGIGLALIWLVYWLVSGHTFFELLSVALTHHLELDRPYLPWLGLHLYDVALFIGLPIAGMACIGFFVAAKRFFKDRALDPFALGLALTLIIVDIAGIARGETARVWLFFMPLLLVVAGNVLNTSGQREFVINHVPGAKATGLNSNPDVVRTNQLDSARRFSAGRLNLMASGQNLFWFAQIMAFLTLAIFVPVIGTELTPPPNEALEVSAPQAGIATFGNDLTLLSDSARVSSDGILLTLRWQATQQMTIPYYFSALLVQPDGQPVSQALNWQPHETRYPVTCWQPGAVVADTVTIPFDKTDPPSGAWWISLSMFDRATSIRLPVTTPNGSQDTQIGLGPVAVYPTF